MASIPPTVDYQYLEWTTSLPPEQEHATKKYRDPLTWQKTSKYSVYGISVLTTLMAAYSISAYVAGVDAMSKELRSTQTIVLVGMATFQTGFAAGPMILAPLSEINGRKPVFLGTYALFNVCTLIIALINNLPGLLVVRFFQGVGASTFSTMVGGVVTDLFDPMSRGIPMSFFATASFSGGLGQLVSGFIVTSLGWRWIYWHQLIINGVLMLAIAVFFKETRSPVVLSRKARALNHIIAEARTISSTKPNPLFSIKEGSKVSWSTQPKTSIVSVLLSLPSEGTELHWKVKSDDQRASISQMIKLSLTRPFYLLFTEPVVFWFSMWISFSWALIFLFFESVPLIFRTSYGFNLQQTGLVLVSMCIGAILGNAFYPIQESLYQRYGHQLPKLGILRKARLGNRTNETTSDIADNPEARLYSACVLSIFMAVGMFMYGATSFPSVPWIFPAIAIAIVTFGAYAIYLSVFTYFADVYTTYASSAMAAQSFCRNVLAGCLPLVVNIMFRRLSFVGASSLLGGIALLLSAVPWVLVLYGPRIRARSSVAKTLVTTS